MKREEYITDEQVMRRANAAVRIALEKKRITGAPVVVYDRKTQNIYLIAEDGTKTVIGKRRAIGRYSERCKR